MKIKFFLIVAVILIINCCRNKGGEYYDKGLECDYQKDYKGAISNYTKVLEIYSKDVNSEETMFAYFGRAEAKYELKDYRGAINDYTKAIEIDTNVANAYIRRGNAKYEIQEYTAAIEDFNKEIKKDPESAEAYCSRGMAKIKLGQKESGCLDLSKVGDLGDERAKELIKEYCK